MALTKTQITGNILTPSGAAPISGRVTARLSAPGSAIDGAATVRVGSEESANLTAGGAISIDLVPNDDIVPSGTYYLVTIILVLANGRRLQWAERWSVPYTPTPIDVGSVPRLSGSPTVYYTTEAAVAASVVADAQAAADAAAAAVANPGSFEVAPTGGSATAAKALSDWMSDATRWNSGGAAYDLQYALGLAMTRRWDFTPRDGSVIDPIYMTGDQGEPFIFARASNAWVVDQYGALQVATAGIPRKGLLGLLVERPAKNIVTAPTAPTTETLTGVTGAHTVWIEGSGSLTITAGTATAASLPITVVAGEVKTFNATVAGTVVCTYSGTVTHSQIESTVYVSDHATSKIPTGNYQRLADAPNVAVDLSARWAIDLVVTIEGSWQTSANPPVRGLWSLGTAGYNANEASLSIQSTSMVFYVADSAAGAKTLTVPMAALGWVAGTTKRITCCADTAAGTMMIYVDGVAPTIASAGGAGTGKWLATARPTILNIGRRGSSLEELDGYVHSLCVNERSNLPGLCIAESPGARTLDLALLGDSRSHLARSSFITAFGSAATITQEGWAGEQTPNTLARWTSRVRGQRHRVLVIQVGVNNFGNAGTAAAAWADLVQILDQAQADGSKVVLTTVFPFKGAGYYTVGRDAERVAYNAQLVSYAAAHPQVSLVDTATDMDDGAGALKVAYDSGDHLHLSVAGNDRFAALVKAALGL